MTEDTKKIVDKIVEACQEKKAKDIAVLDMRDIPGAICQYFVICTGNTPTQVYAIADQISEHLRIELSEKPIKTNGMNDSLWVGIDYGTVIVHVFVPDLREYYSIEQLWADAKIELIPNLD